MTAFRDRRDAGRKLAQSLSHYEGRSDVTIFALPRGGVPVAYEVALALHTPLDLFIVRKLGLPGREQLAMGAIGSGGVRVLNDDVIRILNIPQEVINIVARRELQELEHREYAYRGSRTVSDVRDRTIILIDDGLATGATMRAAVVGIRARHPARIVIAVPTAAREVCNTFQFNVDEIVCLITPKPYDGVGRWYEEFVQIDDKEVRILLEEANRQLLHG